HRRAQVAVGAAAGRPTGRAPPGRRRGGRGRGRLAVDVVVVDVLVRVVVGRVVVVGVGVVAVGVAVAGLGRRGRRVAEHGPAGRWVAVLVEADGRAPRRARRRRPVTCAGPGPGRRGGRGGGAPRGPGGVPRPCVLPGA